MLYLVSGLVSGLFQFLDASLVSLVCDPMLDTTLGFGLCSLCVLVPI
jgi:hypothetical protein